MNVMNDARRECGFSNANIRHGEYGIAKGRVNQHKYTINHFQFFSRWFEEPRISKKLGGL